MPHAGSRLRLILALASLLSAAASFAGPNVPLDAPAWVALRDAVAAGRVPDPLGGAQTLGGEQMRRLLLDSGTPTIPGPPPLLSEGAWAHALERATFRAALVEERHRPYSLPARRRDIAGGVALSCEHQEGRPCGGGAGAWIELDSSAGWGSWLSASTRVRGLLGTGGYTPAMALDRAYLKAQLGPVSIQAGRDVLALGPSARSSLLVAAHAVPADGARIALQPVALPFAPGVRLSLLYFIERLRSPQTFTGTLLDCTRMQLDLFGRVALGGSRLLQLGGDGARPVGGLKGFILEHFSRQGGAIGISNNRLSFDVAVLLPALRSARVYYELAFEDTTDQFFNSLQFDADHLLGVEIRAVGIGIWKRAFIEFEQTGRSSQEHGTFLTGLTSRGRTIGTPLGPDGRSLWLRADLVVSRLRLSPWAEWLRFSSDVYEFLGPPEGTRVAVRGTAEHRQRLGLDAATSLGAAWDLSVSVFGERVGNADLIAGQARWNAGLRAVASYNPAL